MALQAISRAGALHLTQNGTSGTTPRLLLLEAIPADVNAATAADGLDQLDDTTYTTSYGNGVAVSNFAATIDASDQAIKITGDAVTWTGVDNGESVVAVALIHWDTDLSSSTVIAVYNTTDVVVQGNDITFTPDSTGLLRLQLSVTVD